MDGIHDLGGREGFGQIEHETDRETFHARWESRVFAMAQMGFAIGAFRNVDHFRHAIERINPIAYLEDGYYGRWLGGLETALVEAELLPADFVAESPVMVELLETVRRIAEQEATILAKDVQLIRGRLGVHRGRNAVETIDWIDPELHQSEATGH